MYEVSAIVPFMPPLPLLPAAKKSGTRLTNRSAAALLLMEHNSDVDDTTVVDEQAAMTDQSDVDGP